LVQASPSSQPLPTQAPDWQRSPHVRLEWSSHACPSGTAVCWHPRAASQESAVQALPSLQETPPVQRPAWQLAPQARRGLPQLCPFATGAYTHPSVWSHESTVHS
jgi:hypothetical protein